MTSSTRRVVVHAPAKINLHLRVGPPGGDGYHRLVSVFQALSLFEEVTATATAPGAGTSVSAAGRGAGAVPLGADNLAVRAARALAAASGAAPDVALHLRKAVPVAGGMAGGSADAAAALMACDLLWGTGATRAELLDLAAGLGADVPFCLEGGTALGTGRGDVLEQVDARGELHWVLVMARGGLSTPAVFAALDAARADGSSPDPGPLVHEVPADLAAALHAGDPVAVGAALVNDLQAPALALRPDLAATVASAGAAGALGAVVCGSGPTVAVLARGTDHAAELAATLGAHGETKHVCGPVPGARQVEGADLSPLHPAMRGR